MNISGFQFHCDLQFSVADRCVKAQHIAHKSSQSSVLKLIAVFLKN
jgi:hypothetical protein